VEVRHIGEARSLMLDPFLLDKRLTLRAMPVTARVVGRTLKSAVTDVEMTAEDRGAALGDIREHPSLCRAQSMTRLKLGTVRANDIGKFEAGRPESGAHGSTSALG
jgi:hypothetical protein